MKTAWETAWREKTHFSLLLETVKVKVTPLKTLCGAGTADDKDVTVSTDQGNAWLFMHPTLRHPFILFKTALGCVWLFG